MAVYFFVGINIPRNRDQKQERGAYDAYIAQVKPLVERFGGKYLARTEHIVPFAGDWVPDRVILIEFPSREQLQACFSSGEYKKIEGLRTGSVRTTAFVIEGVGPESEV